MLQRKLPVNPTINDLSFFLAWLKYRQRNCKTQEANDYWLGRIFKVEDEIARRLDRLEAAQQLKEAADTASN